MGADVLRVLALSTIASSAAIVLVLALRRLARRHFGAQAAYALWALVPLVPAAVLLPGPVAPESLTATAATISQVLAPIAGAPSPASAPVDPRPWIAAAWLLGMLGSMLWLLRQQRRFVHALGRLVPDGERLRAQAAAGCPALIGAWRPRIVVPCDFDQRFDATERALILAHERLHREHGDAQVNLAAAALRCVFWFNPLVHYAAARLRFDQELACDARVIARFPEARRRYADAMLKAQLADESRQDAGLPVGCYWQASHPLKERIKMLKHPLPGHARKLLGFAMVVAVAGAASYAAWAAQPARPAAQAQAVGGDAVAVDIVLSVDGKPLDESWDSHSENMLSMRHDGAGAPSAWRLRVENGKPFLLAVSRGAESWRFEGNAQAGSDSGLRLDCTIRHNGVVASRPRLVLHAGEPGGVRVGTESAAGFTGFAAAVTLARDASRGTSGAAGAGGGASMPDAGRRQAAYRSMRRIAWPAGAQGSGVVFLKVRVAADGSVASVALDHADPASAAAFSQAAIDSVRDWRFDPAMNHGKAVPSDEIIPVDFTREAEKPAGVAGGTLDAIRVSPLEKPAPAPSGYPPSENVTYRMMHPPKYPPAAVKEKLSGKLKFKVNVDAHGVPQEVDVASSEPPEAARIFAQASIEAIMSWRFNPGMKDGHPAAGWILVPIDYSLTDE